MTHSVRVIVLSSTKVGEKSLVLHTLSRDWGRRSFITTVGNGRSMAFYLPLSILDAEIVENPKSDLWRLHAVSAAWPLNGIRTSAYKNSMTMFMSEVLFRTLRDGTYEDGLYEWCEKSILTLDALESDFSNYHLRFLLEFCGALGFSPSTEDIAPFAGPRLKDIQALLTLSFADSMVYPLSGDSRSEIADSLVKYLGFHTESRLNIRSLSVLRELF